jgi:hypothetical protein
LSMVCLATLLPTVAFAQPAVEQDQHAAYEARKQQRAAIAAAQQAADAKAASERFEAARARWQAAEDSDAGIAAARARLGPGFGSPCAPPVAWIPAAIPQSGVTLAQFGQRLEAVSERDTADAIGHDRETEASVKTDFDALRCFALQRAYPMPDPAASPGRRSPVAAPSSEVAESLGLPRPSYATWILQVADLEGKVRAWVDARDRSLANDEKCIATRGCLDKRYVRRAADEVCGDIAQRAEVQSEIAKEHEYGRQSGAINLARLSELGDELRSSDEQIADAKARYADLAKKLFQVSLCR